MMNESELRDYFAAQASEEDIHFVKPLIPSVTEVLVNPTTGRREVLHNRLPKHWRQVARYIHADLMMDARRERQ